MTFGLPRCSLPPPRARLPDRLLPQTGLSVRGRKLLVINGSWRPPFFCALSKGMPVGSFGSVIYVQVTVTYPQIKLNLCHQYMAFGPNQAILSQ